MNTDNIHNSVTDKLIKGIDKACSNVEVSYGPAGGTIIVEQDLYPFHIVTTDGKAMLDTAKLQDPIENMGLNAIKEAGDRAESESGDGRKTTMLLTRAILKEAQKEKGHPMDIKRSIEQCADVIYQSIESEKTVVKESEISKVAMVASGNEKISHLLEEIYTKIGKDCIVEIDHSGTFDTYYEIKEGVRLRNAGFLSPSMANDDKGIVATYIKPKVLITKQKIATNSEIGPIIDGLSKVGVKELVIFADEVDSSVVQAMALANASGVFKCLVIKAPKLWKDWLYEDFSKITGATIIEPATGVSFKNFELRHLGTCDKIMTTKDETTVIGIKDISTHIAYLNSLNTDDAKIRISWLNTKAGILKIGANSETELSYISKKAKDGRNASYLALKEGVVAGAGTSLVRASEKMPDTAGGRILREALKVPHNTLKSNMGETQSINNDILDPVIVVRNAVKNAISIAGTVLTIRGGVTLNKKENANTAKMPGM